MPVAVGAGVVAGTTRLWPGLAVWENIDEAVASSSVLLGPLLAGLAAWEGMRLRRAALGGRWVLSTRGALGPAPVLMIVTVVAVGAYVACAGLIALPLAGHATAGGPNLLVIAAGGIGVITHSVLGLLAGFAAPFFLVPAVAALAAYVIDLAFILGGGAVNPRVAALGPATQQVAFPFVDVNAAFVGAQLVVQLGAAGVLAAIALTVAAKRVGWGSLAVVAVSGAVAAAGGFAATTMPSGFHLPARKPVFSCSMYGELEVCVHPAFEVASAPLAEAFEPVRARLAGTRLGFDRVELSYRGPGAHATTDSTLMVVFDDLSEGWQDRAVAESAVNLMLGEFPNTPCAATKVVDYESAYWGGAAVVALWVAGVDDADLDPQFEAAQSWFLHLGDDERTAWIDAHTESLCAGTVRPSDFG
ncbi:hypothetical protein [Homoserinibacter sp. GY 40078]|uniref:hypothetical protein n=1 Tax=Homoserinibacter sp. GY 40078 TaxID=2603275 RepID=UPI0011CA83B2|nr:hypothetical protein [Homoserinibacter sp. GY 40078]TXK19794.1 hypothetical protein FVQ89_08020 [Homoserinibacter sp. GY 40078]